MSRICPKNAFAIAYNGLSIFLTEFPHMNEEQRAEVHSLIKKYSKPMFYRNKECRPALLCKVRQDGTILITPHTISTLDIS